MYLGIEIGGTKLQLGVGSGRDGELAALVRHDVDPRQGAAGILDEIERLGHRPDPKASHPADRLRLWRTGR